MINPGRSFESRQGRRWLISLLLGGCCAGCTTLPTLPLAFLKSSPQVEMTNVDPFEENWDHQLAERLGHPLWKRRMDWTPEANVYEGMTYWTLGMPREPEKNIETQLMRGQSPEDEVEKTEKASEVVEVAVAATGEDADFVEDPLLLLTSDKREIVVESLKRLSHRREIVALQALILLAQQGVELTDEEQSHLEKTLLTGEWRPMRIGIDIDFSTNQTSPSDSGVVLNVTTRSAVVEAWCLSLLTSGEGSDAERLSPAGRLLSEGMLPLQVQCQLVRSLCSYIMPSRIRPVQNLYVPGSTHPSELKQAGMEGCLVQAIRSHREEQYNEACWPACIEELENERSAELRSLFGKFVAMTGHPRAIEVLRHQILDSDFLVKTSAVRSSADLLTRPEAREDAIALLRRASTSESEQMRAASLEGLAALSLEELRPFFNDGSAKVKQTLVSTIGRHPSPQAGLMLMSLVGDANLQVQLECLKATEKWPVELAEPVWMEAYRAGSLRTRQEAAEICYARAHITLEAFRGSVESRQQEIQKVSVNHGIKTHYSMNRKGVDSLDVASQGALRREELLEAMSKIDDDLLENDAQAESILATIKPEELPLLEPRILASNPSTRQKFERDILPKSLPEFAAFQKLSSSDVMVRRNAALELKHVGDQRTLTELITSQLPMYLKQEYDVLVWRYLMQAIERDARPSCQEIAREALRSPWPDIQILGCRYVSRHRATALAVDMSRLFESRETIVLLAAIEASSSTGHPVLIDGASASSPGASAEAQHSLRTLLTHPDRNVRQASVIALAKLGDTQGRAELVKLSYDLDPRVRTEAIQAIREMGTPESANLLVKMLWTERNDLVRQEILIALDQIVPVQERPESLREARTLHEKVDSWVGWLDRPNDMVYDQSARNLNLR